MNSRIKEDVSKIFEFWCEIAPSNKTDKTSGYIVESYPESIKDTQIFTDLPHFAYPCDFEKKTVEVYSFVLTDSDSKWRFGFCRHDPNYPNAMIILSYLPWHDMFIKFINKLGEIKNNSYNDFRGLLSDVYNRGVPEPGSSLKVSYCGTGLFIFNRPSHFQLPNILTSHNLSVYYSVAEPKLMIEIFAAMLAERRIIFQSNSLNKLSACIQAAHGFLYPMMWQHIFIPILPMKMKDYLSAPMPFLIGVPDSVLRTLDPAFVGEVVIFDCDKKKLSSPFDDVKSMPTELISQMKKQLSNTNEHRDDKFSKIFLGILVQLIGGYRDALKYSQGEKITWDCDAFIDSRPQNLRPFLRKMLTLQIFRQFIEDRLDMLNTGDGISDEFELETVRYADILGKKKPYKEFLRSVKDKTNPAMKSAVKSVREGSKGVKSAYKDLKTKIRENQTSTTTMYSRRTNDFGGNHHSAPSSPIVVKRTQSDIPLRYNPTNDNNSVVQLSSSLYNHNINNNNHNNINLNKNPPLSPPSSNSSSEMNLLQELQQHALFKSPAVDRTLKPNLSNANRGRYMNSITTSSSQQNHHVHSSNFLNNKSRTKTPELPQPPSQSLNTLSIFDTPPSSSEKSFDHINSKFNNLNIFDNKIFNLNSPPIPPPRNINLIKNKIDNLMSSSSSSSALPPPHLPSSFSLQLDNSFDMINRSDISSRLNESSPNNSDDLIKLDSTTTSFELEDFDPLNQNAKPLPLQRNQTATQLNFNNPLYPYFKPKSNNCQDDIDLLKKYGLDKFSMPKNSSGNNSSSSSIAQNKLTNGLTTKTESDKNEWIQFE